MHETVKPLGSWQRARFISNEKQLVLALFQVSWNETCVYVWVLVCGLCLVICTCGLQGKYDVCSGPGAVPGGLL